MDFGKLVMSLVWKALRWLVLNVPDRRIARFLSGVRWIVWVATGDPDMRAVITEVVEIFKGGPPETAIIRKLFREADPDFAADMLRGAIKI